MLPKRERPLFFTLGVFILDDIHHADPQIPAKFDVIGGGGTFATLGSRIVSPKPQHHRIKFIVNKGSDFPDDVRDVIEGWKVSVDWRADMGRLTTRGWNYYHDGDENMNDIKGVGGERDFKYMTPLKRIEISELKNVDPESLHLICAVQRCREVVELMKREKRDTVLIYEPVPYDCVPGNRETLLDLIQDVDILSPNAKEAAELFGMEEPSEKEALEELAMRFMPYLNKKTKFGTGSALVLRCGGLGSYTLVKEENAGILGTWYAPYHNEKDGSIVDPTGCGNTFVGSFVTAFVLSGGSYEVASVLGSIGSGVCIEQVGVPTLEGEDIWNGVGLGERVDKYLRENGILGFKDSVYKVLDLKK